MSDLPELYSFFIKHSAEIVELLQEASKILREPLSIYFLGDSTGPCIRIGDTIDIVPVVMTRKSIVGDRKVHGYQLVTYKHYPGTRFDPPDVEEVDLGEPNQSQIQIVIEAIKWYVAIVLEQNIENICIERSLREE